MLDHENLNKKISLNENKSIDDTSLMQGKLSLDKLYDGNVILEKPRSSEVAGSTGGETKWLKGRLKKLEEENERELGSRRKKAEQDRHAASHAEGGHQSQLDEILKPVENMMSAERQLITVPENTVLLPGLGKRFHEKLKGADRIKKKKDKKHELNQKEKNAFMVENAMESYAKDCHAAMNEAMKKREVTCDDAKDFRDLAQFVGSKDQAFTLEDKERLLDSYLGKSNEEGPEGKLGQDRQLAMDLMTKALMAIDIETISIDSDAAIARNAEKFEAIAGKVAAYDRQLKKYNDNAGGDENNGYLDSLDKGLRQRVTLQLDKLRRVAFFYVNARDVIRNKYYKTHLNSEMAATAAGNAGNGQKALAGAIKNYKSAAVNFKKQNHLPLSPEQIRQQNEKLQSNLDRMEYFSEKAVKTGYSSKALMSSSTFQGLFMSFDRLYENGRSFGANSFRMKIVKKHIKDIREILNKAADSFETNPKAGLMRELSQLARACSDYHEGRRNKRIITDRHQSVIDIMNYSRKCLDFVSSMTDVQFEEITSKKQNAPLKEIFQSSEMVVDENRREKKDSGRELLRMQHYRSLPEEMAKKISNSSRLKGCSFLRIGIDTMMAKYVEKDENSFNTVKMDILKYYEDFQKICSDYTSDNSPSFESGRMKYDLAGEMAEYSRNMIKLIKRVRYSDIKSKNLANIKWEDLIFGDEIVVIRANEKKKDDQRRIVFSGKKEDMEQYRYNKALEFISGDRSMYTEYKPSVYIKKDGTKKTGLSYKSPRNTLRKEHRDQIFTKVSAEQIREAADKGNMSVIYSENALRQLTTIRIMDTLFGRQTRSSNTLSYTAASQMVFGEPRIVIREVGISDYNYFSEQMQHAGGREMNTSVLDENGRLIIGAYDRNVADRIMSLTAEQCLEEFGAQGIKINDEARNSFISRFNVMKAAFKMDATQEDGWRYKQDHRDEEKIAEDLKEKRSTMKKYQRWGYKDDDEVIKTVKKEIMELREKKVRDKPGMYNRSLRKTIDNGQDLGLVEEALLPKYKEVEQDQNIEGVNEILEAEQEQILQGEKNVQEEEQEKEAKKAQKLRADAAKKKILKIREVKKKYRARSEKLRLAPKEKMKKFIEKQMNKPEAKEASDEFKKIIELFSEYVNMDVNTLNCLRRGKIIKGRISADFSDFIREGEILKKALRDAESRYRTFSNIPKDQLTGVQALEKYTLSELLKTFYNLPNGMLKVRSAFENIKVEDESFREITVDSETNKITASEPSQMIDYSEVPLFAHEPTVEDISQGQIGDCYLLSTMASIVEKNPRFIKEMMRENPDHTVTVRFFDNEGKEMYVTVNKTVPKDLSAANNGEVKELYVKGALWIKMLEKAFVASRLIVHVNELDIKNASGRDKDQLAVINELKKNNSVSYKTISGAEPTAFSRFITGKTGDIKTFDPGEEFESQMGKRKITDLTSEQDDFVKKLGDMFKNGSEAYSLVASSVHTHDTGEGTGLENDVEARGVFNAHGYTIMGYEEIDGEKIVILRNPWGYAAEDEYYDERSGQVSSRLVENGEQGGYLFLPLDKFFNLFKRFHLIKIR